LLLLGTLPFFLGPLLGFLLELTQLDERQEPPPVRAVDEEGPDLQLGAEPESGAPPSSDVRHAEEPTALPPPPLQIGRELGVYDVVFLRPVPLVEVALVLHLLLAVGRRPDLEDDLREDAAFFPHLVAAAVALRPAERHVHVRRLTEFDVTVDRVDQV